jgi:hypothetical protein
MESLFAEMLIVCEDIVDLLTPDQHEGDSVDETHRGRAMLQHPVKTTLVQNAIHPHDVEQGGEIVSKCSDCRATDPPSSSA